jgi:hypothetical protein
MPPLVRPGQDRGVTRADRPDARQAQLWRRRTRAGSYKGPAGECSPSNLRELPPGTAACRENTRPAPRGQGPRSTRFASVEYCATQQRRGFGGTTRVGDGRSARPLGTTARTGTATATVTCALAARRSPRRSRRLPASGVPYSACRPRCTEDYAPSDRSGW